MSYNLSRAFEHALASIIADAVTGISLDAGSVHCGFVDDDITLPAISCSVTGDHKGIYGASFSTVSGNVEVVSGIKESGGYGSSSEYHSSILACIESALSSFDLKARLKNASTSLFHVYHFQLEPATRVVTGVQRFQTTIPFSALVVYTPQVSSEQFDSASSGGVFSLGEYAKAVDYAGEFPDTVTQSGNFTEGRYDSIPIFAGPYADRCVSSGAFTAGIYKDTIENAGAFANYTTNAGAFSLGIYSDVVTKISDETETVGLSGGFTSGSYSVA